MSQRPIFLLSLPRSGSTLVQRVLAAHEEVSTVPEPWVLLPHLYAMRERGMYAEYTHVLAARAIRDFVQHLPEGEEDYWAAFRAFALQLYERASGGRGTYFLDKTPRYHFVVSELMRAFPDAKYVFLWRNPLAVVASIVETWTRGRWNVDRWRADLFGIGALVEAYEAARDRVCAVRYEDLVADPEPAWRSIFDHLELAFAPELLERFAEIRLEARMGDPTGQERYDRLSTEPLEKWRSVLAHPVRKAWCRRYLRWIGAERLATMGYDLEDLLASLGELPSSPRMIPSDLLHGGYWAVARRRKEAAFRRMAPRVR